MIHYLYVGHFKRDGDFIRFERQTETKPVLHKPAVRRPLDPAIVASVLALKGCTSSRPPDSWGMCLDESGFISWDRFCGDADAVAVVVDLAHKTRCDLADYSSLSFIEVCELEKLLSESRDSNRRQF
ncbi:MAG: hypothetical protein KDA57_20455 [Planctomycetales bacterium]|nr:hypothetical protein [Planctomycetales bacterium]